MNIHQARKCANCGMELSEKFVKEYKIPIYGFADGTYLCPSCYEARVL